MISYLIGQKIQKGRYMTCQESLSKMQQIRAPLAMRGPNSDHLLNFAENVENIKQVISFTREKVMA